MQGKVITGGLKPAGTVIDRKSFEQGIPILVNEKSIAKIIPPLHEIRPVPVSPSSDLSRIETLEPRNPEPRNPEQNTLQENLGQPDKDPLNPLSLLLWILIGGTLTGGGSYFYHFRKLEQLAWRDGLTSIANRQYFEKYLSEQWPIAKKSRGSLTVILCDVDFFKLFNDTYGHQAGDKCLQQVAAALKSTMQRSEDLVARYGGEEFVIVLPNIPGRWGATLAEQLRCAVEALNIPHSRSQKGYVTISLGVAEMTSTSTLTPSQLLDLADKNLYQAKHQGRNRVIFQDQNTQETIDQEPNFNMGSSL